MGPRIPALALVLLCGCNHVTRYRRSGRAAEQRYYEERPVATTRPGFILGFGSPLRLGNRPLPLLHLHDRLSQNGYVAFGWDLHDDSLRDRPLGEDHLDPLAHAAGPLVEAAPRARQSLA